MKDLIITTKIQVYEIDKSNEEIKSKRLNVLYIIKSGNYNFIINN